MEHRRGRDGGRGEEGTMTSKSRQRQQRHRRRQNHGDGDGGGGGRQYQYQNHRTVAGNINVNGTVAVAATSEMAQLARAWSSLADDDELHDLKVASLVDSGCVETNRVILAKRSLVFRRMLYGNFRESSSDTIQLEFPLKVIQVVMAYIYSNTLVLSPNDDDGDGDNGNNAALLSSTSDEEDNDYNNEYYNEDESIIIDVDEHNVAMGAAASKNPHSKDANNSTSCAESSQDEPLLSTSTHDIIDETRFLVQVAICAEYLELSHLGQLVYESLFDLLDEYPNIVACAVVDETLDAATASSYDGFRSHVCRMYDTALRVIQGQPKYCLLGIPDQDEHYYQNGGEHEGGRPTTGTHNQGAEEESIFKGRYNAVHAEVAAAEEVSASSALVVDHNDQQNLLGGGSSLLLAEGSTAVAAAANEHKNKTEAGENEKTKNAGMNTIYPHSHYEGAENCGVLLLRATALSKVIALQPMNCDEITLFRAIQIWHDYHQEEDDHEHDHEDEGEGEHQGGGDVGSSGDAVDTSSGHLKPHAAEEELMMGDGDGDGVPHDTVDRSSSNYGKGQAEKGVSSPSRKQLNNNHNNNKVLVSTASTLANNNNNNHSSVTAAKHIVHSSISLKRIKPSELRDEVMPSKLATLEDLNDALLHQALLAEQCQVIDFRRLPVWSSSGTDIVTASSYSGSSAYLQCPPLTEDGRLGQAHCVYKWSVEVLTSDGKILMGIFGGPDPNNPTFKAHVKGDGRRFKYNKREALTIQEVEACQHLKFSAGSVIEFTLDFSVDNICLKGRAIHKPTDTETQEEVLFSHIRDEFAPNKEELILHPGVYCRSPCSIRLTSFQ
jgi:hypothetical protein